MIVNDERIKELIRCATVDCNYCPLLNKDHIDCNNEPCLLAVTKWLTEFDIQEALESGAHIVNDQAIFPPQSIEMNF